MTRIFRLGVAGESHPNRAGTSRQEIIARTGVGETVHLVPEPDNPFDAKAVKVMRRNGEQIGYLPRGHGLTVAIRAGFVSARVHSIRAGDPLIVPPLRQVVLEIARTDRD